MTLTHHKISKGHYYIEDESGKRVGTMNNFHGFWQGNYKNEEGRVVELSITANTMDKYLEHLESFLHELHKQSLAKPWIRDKEELQAKFRQMKEEEVELVKQLNLHRFKMKDLAMEIESHKRIIIDIQNKERENRL